MPLDALENQHPYEKWKTVTEADFVTLFIKTWFAFVSTLRELYADKAVFANLFREVFIMHVAYNNAGISLCKGLYSVGKIRK